MASLTCPAYYTEQAGACVRQDSYFEGAALLSQGVGYGIVLGFGAFFAVFTSFLVWLEGRYVGAASLCLSGLGLLLSCRAQM
ncbi:hypothetical protein GOP47_0028464 [Adiantum capillus-veneris]|nr:hypothetical protein GOP47_0028464 [Adiantum capillus-veneris]